MHWEKLPSTRGTHFFHIKKTSSIYVKDLLLLLLTPTTKLLKNITITLAALSLLTAFYM